MNATFPNMMLKELEKAERNHAPINSAHEATKVIEEELEEFWEEVRKKKENRNREAMLNELVQTATMCWRAARDLGLCE